MPKFLDTAMAEKQAREEHWSSREPGRDRLQAEKPGPLRGTLLPIQTRGTRPPLLCVHPTTGTVRWFYDFARHLGPDQPVLAFQPGDIHRGDAPRITIEEVATGYVDELQASGVSPPYRLGGMCVGGLIAFEMAQQLTSRGRDVDVVILIDTGHVPHPPWTARQRAVRAAKQLGRGWTRPLLPGVRRRVRELVSNVRRDLAATDLDAVRPWDWTADRDITFWTLMLASRRARRNLRLQYALTHAMRAYRPRPYVGRVVVLRPDVAPKEHLPEYDWPRLVTGPFTEFVVAEHHGVMMRPPHVREVARHVTTVLR